MQPTKLPDDLFPADDRQWQDADYPARVSLLVLRYMAVARVYEARDGGLARALGERDLLLAELKDLRERNAALVSEIERMHREKMTTRHNEGAGT
jgi:uncharacterized small protein (DUF1192 family)